MTKFEEEFKALTSWDWINIDLIQQILTRFGNWHSDEEFQKLFDKYSNLNDNYEKEVIRSSKLESQIADVVNLSEGWVSPEEHQARVNELIEAKEKKIKQLRKINHLYKKSKENAERLAVDRGERLNQAQDELASLESQLQQQALPVVPEWLDIEIKNFKSTSKHPTVDVVFGVADAIVAVKNGNTHSKLYDYLFCGKQDVCNQHQAIFALAFITGKYEVEKPQLFYLKHIDMSKRDKDNDYFAQIRNDRFEHNSVKSDTFPQPEIVGVRFTQSEIDSMQTGSYEQIEVTE